MSKKDCQFFSESTRKLDMPSCTVQFIICIYLREKKNAGTKS